MRGQWNEDAEQDTGLNTFERKHEVLDSS